MLEEDSEEVRYLDVLPVLEPLLGAVWSSFGHATFNGGSFVVY
jgi:hypothetical protein